jgi:hypothetical protein
MRVGLVVGLIVLSVVAQRRFGDEPVFTSEDLIRQCTGGATDRSVCAAYIRGFSDGNRWVLRDSPHSIAQAPNPTAVCIPNAASIDAAADLLLAYFADREVELRELSPYRALSRALSGKYPCS